MKYFTLFSLAILLSLSNIACNKKKDSSASVRGARGYHAGTSPGYQSGLGQTGGSGWDALQSSPKSDLRNNNMQQAAPDFLQGVVPADQIGNITGNYPTNVVVGMNIARSGNSVNPQQTRLGLVFWDSYTEQGAAPITNYFGPESQTQISGSLSGGNVDVYFRDQYGIVRVTGSIMGSSFNGQITYQNTSGGSMKLLGQFMLPVNGTIF